MDRIYFVSMLVMCFRPTTAALVARPSDALVFEGERAVFECGTNLTNPITPVNWTHIPVDSTPVMFFTNGGFGHDNEFYKSSITVDRSIAGRYDLVIANVTTRHAGRYMCDYFTEYANRSRVSAKLDVLEKTWACYDMKYSSKSALEMTCNMTLTGNIIPNEICTGEWYNPNVVVFNEQEHITTESRAAKFDCSFNFTKPLPRLVHMFIRVNNGMPEEEVKEIKEIITSTVPVESAELPVGTTTVQVITDPQTPGVTSTVPMIRNETVAASSSSSQLPTSSSSPSPSSELYTSDSVNSSALLDGNSTEKMRVPHFKPSKRLPTSVIVSIVLGVLAAIVIGVFVYIVCKDRIANRGGAIKFINTRYRRTKSSDLV